MALVLSACDPIPPDANGNGNVTDIRNAQKAQNNSGDNAGSLTTPQTSAPATNFISAYEKTYDFGSDGYTGTLTFQSWYGVLGTGEPMTHPAAPNIQIPAVDKQSLVIPILITVRNTTSNTSFEQDLTLFYSTPFSFYFDDSWSQPDGNGGNRVISNSHGGDSMTFAGYYGYYIVSDIITPTSPALADVHIIDKANGVATGSIGGL